MQTIVDKLKPYNVPDDILSEIAMLEMDLQRSEAILNGTWPDAAKILAYKSRRSAAIVPDSNTIKERSHNA